MEVTIYDQVEKVLSRLVDVGDIDIRESSIFLNLLLTSPKLKKKIQIKFLKNLMLQSERQKIFF